MAKIETYTIHTSMGSVNCGLSYPLSFLSDIERVELDRIGYTGKNIKGEEMSRVEYLNSLNKGTFEVKQLKYDNGDFSEKFMIIRVF